MSLKLAPYPAYKSSGTDWLDDVPQGWQVVSNGSVMKPRKRIVGNQSPDFKLLSLTLRGVIPRDMERPEGKFPADFGTYQVVEPNDLVFCLFDMDETPRTVGIAHERGMITGAYTVFSCVDPETARFVCLFYLAIDDQKGLRPFYTGLRKVVQKSRFLGVKIPLPPANEQRLISDFLDHNDRRINRLIRAKSRLIDLLSEQKQAIINRAVTRGLDPSVSVKFSGIDWLGDVPDHWEVRRLSQLATRNNAGEVIDKGWWGEGEEVLYTCAREKLKSTFVGFPEWKRTTARDVLLTRNGTPYVHLPSTGAIYSNVVQRVSLRHGVSRHFVRYALEESARGLKGYGVSIESLNYGMWKILPVHLPPLEEQEEIVSHIEREVASLDRASSKISREIALLREYRARLIADVVTGKLDVRGIELPPLDEDDAFDEIDADDETDEMIEDTLDADD